MDKNYLLLFFLFTFSVSHAQVKIGIMGGPQSTSITEKNSIHDWDSTTGKYNGNRVGFHIGVMAEIPFGKRSHFYFQPAVLYTQKGNTFSKNLMTTVADSVYVFHTTKSLTLRYIDVPLNIAYKLPVNLKKTTSILISAGPYLSLFTNGNRAINQNDQFITHTEVRNTIVNKTEDVKAGTANDNYRAFGYGFNARAGLESGKVTITGFYSQGLDNLYYASYSGTFKHKVFGVSLGVWISGKKVKVLKDTDKDGIPDNQDGCPLEAGYAINNGCPDTDADGVSDNKDLCPGVAGVLKYNGCPIPDTDKDGINDDEDKCPDVAGSEKNNGCPAPELNKDSVSNKESEMVDTVAGTDKNDSLANKEEMKNFQGAAGENILFSTNSAVLFPQSIKSLKVLADLLKENPALKLNVDGYTDNTGTDKANIIVAARRAHAVKEYLTRKGIDASRIITNALGNTNPVADNSTVNGRSKNRRVELRLEEVADQK